MARKKALDSKCPNCGGIVVYKPSLRKFTCAYCDGIYTKEELKKEKKKKEIENNKENVSYITYSCNNCGAEIIADEDTVATFCIYCGNTAILKNKVSGEFAPDFILPFQKEKEDAIAAFKKLTKGRPFVPKDFTAIENIEKIRGVYIPFWLYDVLVEGSIVCDAHTIQSWRSGNTMYTKTSYYKLYRSGNMKYEKVPVDGSTRFDNAIMNSIEPFHYQDLIPYSHEYLSGFFALKYDVSLQEAFPDANTRCLNSSKNLLYEDCIGYPTKIITENTLSSKVMDKKYVLLPVWMVNIKYKEKLYIFAMNGQTGEFIGDIPLDKKKIILWGIILFLLFFSVVILLSLLFHYLGRYL